MTNHPRVWEVIGYFKDECHSRGWKTSENEDWIKVDNEFHNFLWARNIHASTFKKIVTACKCAIKQGISYQVNCHIRPQQHLRWQTRVFKAERNREQSLSGVREVLREKMGSKAQTSLQLAQKRNLETFFNKGHSGC